MIFQENIQKDRFRKTTIFSKTVSCWLCNRLDILSTIDHTFDILHSLRNFFLPLPLAIWLQMADRSHSRVRWRHQGRWARSGGWCNWSMHLHIHCCLSREPHTLATQPPVWWAWSYTMSVCLGTARCCEPEDK